MVVRRFIRFINVRCAVARETVGIGKLSDGGNAFPGIIFPPILRICHRFADIVGFMKFCKVVYTKEYVRVGIGVGIKYRDRVIRIVGKPPDRQR